MVELADPLLKHAEIGRRVGCSREYVRQVATQIGAPGLAFRSEVQFRAKVGRLCDTFPDEGTPLWYAWTEARKHGLSVSRILDDVKGLLATSLSVNEKVCQVSAVFAASDVGTAIKFGKYTISTRPAGFMIFTQMIKKLPWRVHIVPVETLNRYYKKSDARTNIYIPLRWAPAYNNHYARLDWRDYENAWDLLRDGEESPTPTPSVSRSEPGGSQ